VEAVAPIDRSVPFEVAALVGCGVMTAVGAGSAADMVSFSVGEPNWAPRPGPEHFHLNMTANMLPNSHHLGKSL
jgi:hypothetical protein